MMLKLAVITPTYNRPELFERLHVSCLANGDAVWWRHFAVDDGSDADYGPVFERCREMSGRLTAERIANAGPLAARNRALDLALEAGCTHVCFVDDDDRVEPDGFAHVQRRLAEHPDVDWFYFRALADGEETAGWPAEPTPVSWFDDIVRARRFGSDNFVVISTDLIGPTRFSTFGRNQREWTFFLELSKRQDRVLVCPEVIRRNEYQPGGLSNLARRGGTSWEQVLNNLERAFRYWLMRPLSPDLLARLVWQAALFPLRAAWLAVVSLTPSARR